MKNIHHKIERNNNIQLLEMMPDKEIFLDNSVFMVKGLKITGHRLEMEASSSVVK